MCLLGKRTCGGGRRLRWVHDTWHFWQLSLPRGNAKMGWCYFETSEDKGGSLDGSFANQFLPNFAHTQQRMSWFGRSNLCEITYLVCISSWYHWPKNYIYIYFLLDLGFSNQDSWIISIFFNVFKLN